MRQAPVVKSEQLGQLGFDPAIFGRSWVTVRDLPMGHCLIRDDLAFKKPGGGLSYEQLSALVGKPLRHPLVKDHRMDWHDVDSE